MKPGPAGSAGPGPHSEPFHRGFSPRAQLGRIAHSEGSGPNQRRKPRMMPTLGDILPNGGWPLLGEDALRQLGWRHRLATLPLLIVESGLRGVAAGAEIGVVGVPGQELVQVPEGGEPLLLPLAVLGLLSVARPASADRPGPGVPPAMRASRASHPRPSPSRRRWRRRCGGRRG